MLLDEPAIVKFLESQGYNQAFILADIIGALTVINYLYWFPPEYIKKQIESQVCKSKLVNWSLDRRQFP